MTSFTSSARVRVAGMKLRPPSKPESAAEGEFAAKAMRKLPEDLAEAMAAARAVANPVDGLSRGRFEGPWKQVLRAKLPPNLLQMLRAESKDAEMLELI